MPSVNFNHHGAPKFWYCIGRRDYRKFEAYVKDTFPENFLECSQFLRHKTTIINPYFLKNELPDINITKICQNPGEFVVTMNSGYHAGFNLGFNIAEAVNFATPDWLPEFPKFKSCHCHSNSVFIDPFLMFENLSKIPRYKKNKYYL